MKPFVLTILDGWGYSRQKTGNAILNANTPNIEDIEKNYPSLLLQASGNAVGMSWGESGNSEVGHLTIGSGRVIFQYLSQINKAISDGHFFSNPAFVGAIEHVQQNQSSLNLVGLLTSGSVHASFSHLLALVDLAQKNSITKLNIHLFTDGKDSGLKEAPVLIKKLEDHLTKSGIGKIVSIIGRNFAMERTKNWEFTEATYDLLTEGKGEIAQDIFSKLEDYYSKGLTDSDIPPTIIDPEGFIKDNDAIIFFNFREDSMRQITSTFIEDHFDIFKRKSFSNLYVATMTRYMDAPLNVAFKIPDIKNGLVEVLSNNGKKQFHIAETEKYAHVTYFFNCLNNKPFDGETDIFVDSDKRPNEKPEMKAEEIGEKVVAEINSDIYDFILVNFANADILSHTGNLEQTSLGIEAIDRAIGKIKNSVLEKGGTMIITADHGNAEGLIYKMSGEKETKHNDNPVPFYLVSDQYRRERTGQEIAESMSEIKGLLSEVAPTILELMGIEKPEEMTGESLLKQL